MYKYKQCIQGFQNSDLETVHEGGHIRFLRETGMTISDNHNKRLSTFFQFSFLLLFLFSSIIIISILVINQKSLEKRITTLEDEVQEKFITQTELLLDSERMTAETLLAAFNHDITEMSAEIYRYINTGTAAAGNRITQANTRIQEINALYSNLLAEQQKRMLDSLNTQQARDNLSTQQPMDSLYTQRPRDSFYTKQAPDGLYTQQAILEMEQDAARLFREGKYAMASAQYAAVAQEQPENTDARFYYLYSLFLSNKLDRDNYRQIREGLEALERYGYYRMETKEMLEYITSEEDGFLSNVGDVQ
jgi:hypothetical protein